VPGHVAGHFFSPFAGRAPFSLRFAGGRWREPRRKNVPRPLFYRSVRRFPVPLFRFCL
jgi:hypothetical protein